MSDAGKGSVRAHHVKVPDRRDILIGGSAAATAGLILPGTSEANTSKAPEKMPVQAGDRFQLIKGSHKDKLVQPDLLELGDKPIEAFPFEPGSEVLRRKYRLNRLLVLKLNPDEMDDDTRARTDETGVLVFSAICTHRGCTIKSWLEEERELRCHCHLSRFAALNVGRVMNGPAKRELPMVPVKVDEEGFVVATDTFTSKPGAAKK
jgi:Rieske Fe-S protein